MKKVAVISVSKPGRMTGDKIAEALSKRGFTVKHFSKREYADPKHPLQVPYDTQASEVIRSAYQEFEGIITVMALGGLVRVLASLLQGKFIDPAVITVDDAGKYVISVISGHYGGANELTSTVAEDLNALPIITTATESLGKTSVEEISRRLNCELMNKDSLLPVNAAIVNGKNVACFIIGEGAVENLEGVQVISLSSVHLAVERLKDLEAAIIVSRESPLEEFTSKIPVTWLKPAELKTIVGLGSVKDVSGQDVIEALTLALASAGLKPEDVDAVASIKDEPGMLEACRALGLKFLRIKPYEIAGVTHPEMSSPSEAAMKAVGLAGVAEPAALWLAGEGSRLLLRKIKVKGKVTVAIAQGPGRKIALEDYGGGDLKKSSGNLYLVGVGPGSQQYLTQRTLKILASSDIVAGYSFPLQVVKDLVAGKEVIQLTLKDQMDKLLLISRMVDAGKTACIIFTGDSCFSEGELVERIGRVFRSFEIVPGISSVQLAAAKAKIPLERAKVLTFHVSGDLDSLQQELILNLKDGRPLILLPRPWDFMPTRIADYLISHGVSAETPVRIFERLSLEDEKEFVGRLGEIPRREYSDLTVMIIGR